ncbi:hypothetical protein PP747_gp101 [Rhizobium phage RHph_Y38]|uniref:Uncharacterized protein n=1 Tax=Rhizobium phage RHph_Y38 TaxID=2509781 RepID=A0A7S5QXB6_9CAUD|nr:hypothetical protein PP747_gp101 [Rhizobium phage RHph_Y38]QIG67797.1 hypothetical protein EVB52_098 [Rhizobium phage RHph_Y38]
MKVKWYYGTVVIGDPMSMMRKKKAYPPSPAEITATLTTLRENVKYGMGVANRLYDDDLRVLVRYIEFLEEQLGAVTEEYQGIPTEYFNMVRKENLEWRPLGPTRLYEEIRYTPFK